METYNSKHLTDGDIKKIINQYNKDKVKLRYKENQNPTQIKCLFRYYKNLNRVGEFKIKHNEKYNYLVGEGIIVKEDNLNNRVNRAGQSNSGKEIWLKDGDEVE